MGIYGPAWRVVCGVCITLGLAISVVALPVEVWVLSAWRQASSD